MTNVTKSITIPVEIWLPFEEKLAGRKFSQWVQEQIKREIKYKKNKRLPVPEKPRCVNSPRYKDIVIKAEMCRVCGIPGCEDRLD